MRSTRLQSFTVLHQRLNCISINCTCKPFRLRLKSLNNRHCHILLGKLRINIYHLFGLFNCLFFSSMSSVTLLPKEFGSSEEQPCTHFPTYHISPLVNKKG